MADWVKYCPKCGEENKGHRSTCRCGADLHNVPKVPKGSVNVPPPPEKLNSSREPEVQSPPPEQTQPQNEQVRLCSSLDCNHINSETRRLCEKCGAPADMMSRQEAEAEILRRSQEINETPPPKPAPKNPEASPPQAKHKAVYACLVSDDGSYKYEMKPGKITIGRQSEMAEHLQPLLWVGRKHAELNFADGILTVQDLDSQNHTYVNGKKVRSGEVRELADGDVLGLGDSRKDTQDSNAAFFRIELR